MSFWSSVGLRHWLPRLLVLCLMACAQVSQAQFSTVYNFDTSSKTDGYWPDAPLMQASDGNFYGTTSGGGASGNGTVFRMTTGGTLTTLYSFSATSSSGTNSDGANPCAGLIQASDGNLYGTTLYGGSHPDVLGLPDYGSGTVFRLHLHWQPLIHQPSFKDPSTNQVRPIQASQMLLLTDGTVMCQEYLTSNWWRLKPDAFGSYVNGTWSTKPILMPTGYAPLYYASAVLADGRVVVVGGEYNLAPKPVADTNLGAIYNPINGTNGAWQVLTPPKFMNINGPNGDNIGDAQSCVLPNGQFLLAHPFDTQMALLDPVKLAWTVFTPKAKADRFDEEGWNLLPDRTILTIDILNAPNAERYKPDSSTWELAGSTPQSLVDGARHRRSGQRCYVPMAQSSLQERPGITPSTRLLSANGVPTTFRVSLCFRTQTLIQCNIVRPTVQPAYCPAATCSVQPAPSWQQRGQPPSSNSTGPI